MVDDVKAATIALGLVLIASNALAIPKVFKHDKFSEDLSAAANEVNGQSLPVHPGFVQTEAFGQLYKPDPAHYPLKIEGIDLILAASPNQSPQTRHAQIEIWNSTSAGPDPGTVTPLFQISTTDLFNIDAGEFGVPLTGNVGLKIDFDYEDPDGHPDLITEGNIWVMIRYTSAAEDLYDILDPTNSYWPTIQCLQSPGLTCGCQVVAPFDDIGATPQANVMHVVSPLGQCSGSLDWMWATDVGVSGDFLVRLRADVSGTECVPSCDGKACGDDGCEGSCGSCGADQVCNNGVCESFCLADCAGKNCGDDGCGGVCGTCAGSQTCTNGVCTGAGACNPPCQAGQTCNNGVCEGGCTPNCNGGNCGDDGCGGSCGTCSGGQTCVGNICSGGTPGDLAIIEISPTSGQVGEYVDVAITGAGFQQGLDVLVGGKSLAGIKVTSASLIQAQIPPDIPEGTHTVIVANPDTKTATLTEAYTALPAPADTCGNTFCELNLGENTATCPFDCAPSSGDAGGCSCESGNQMPVGGLAAFLALMALVAMRGRREPKLRRIRRRQDR